MFFGGVALRFREQDFEPDRTMMFGSGAAWPFGYGELAPFYERAEQLLDVAGAAGADPCEPARTGPYPQQTPALSRTAARVAAAARRLGLRPFPLPLAINFRQDGARPACLRCSTCDTFACAIGAKNDVVTALLRSIAQHVRRLTNASASPPRRAIRHARSTSPPQAEVDMQPDKRKLSLAKGPVAIIGAVMVAYGVLAMLLGNAGFDVVNVPDGPITYGETFLGLETNGWTNLLWIGAGALLVLGSPMHRGAKATAALVGAVLGAVSVISLVTQWADENWGVFGIFAANNWTTLAWGAVATVLLIAALLPRVRVGSRAGAQVEPDRPIARPAPPPGPSEPGATGHTRLDSASSEGVVTERDRPPAGTGSRVVAPADDDGWEDDPRAPRR